MGNKWVHQGHTTVPESEYRHAMTLLTDIQGK